eukprot:6070119-Pyramimonas_sp.AAC.1
MTEEGSSETYRACASTIGGGLLLEAAEVVGVCAEEHNSSGARRGKQWVHAHAAAPCMCM